MKMNNPELVEKLNQALAWELRASAMYAHYAAYVGGIHRLHLAPYFEGEATESHQHAQMVRTAIVKLGGIAVTDRAREEIVHTTNYREILQECLKTEQTAADTYLEVLKLVDEDDELFDVLQQVYFAEARAVEEINQLLV